MYSWRQLCFARLLFTAARFDWRYIDFLRGAGTRSFDISHIRWFSIPISLFLNIRNVEGKFFSLRLLFFSCFWWFRFWIKQNTLYLHIEDTHTYKRKLKWSYLLKQYLNYKIWNKVLHRLYHSKLRLWFFSESFWPYILLFREHSS